MRNVLVASLAALALSEPYRSISGSGNNLADPTMNEAGTRFLARATYYADGKASAGTGPNPRLISNTLMSAPPFRYNSYQVAALAAAYGQFVAHDLIMTSAQPAAAGADLVSVTVPKGDPDFDPASAGNVKLTQTRNIWDAATGSSAANPRRQINSATGWLDLSTVYGQLDARTPLLRRFSGGLLLSDPVNGAPMNGDPAAPASCVDQEHPGITDPCNLRLTGDPRGNVAPGILSLHGLYILEHNWWAGVLASRDATATDETLFQEARKRVIAEHQQITLGEYLPVLLRSSLPAYEGYNSSLDARVDGAFAVAAYRYGHSGLNSLYLCLMSDGSACSGGHLLLREVYFRPAYLAWTGISSLLRGMVSTPESAIDTRLVPDVRNFLEGLRNDLAVMDILRGRDFGLPSYSQARVELGLAPPTSYADISSDATVAAQLEALYGAGNFAQVELWVGGLAEAATSGGMIGPTFAAIIRAQFLRTRDGDRFYWQNPELRGADGASPYLPDADAAAIASVTLSEIVARVTDWTSPPAAMFAVSAIGPGAAAGGAGSTTAALGAAVSLQWAPPTLSLAGGAASDSVTLTFTLAAPAGADGVWVGFGFGASMASADTWLLTYAGGAGAVVDSFSMDEELPSGNEQQDVTLLASSSSATETTWTVRRVLRTGDAHDVDIVAGSMSVIYAWSTSTGTPAYHGANRGVASVNLLAGAVTAGAPAAPAAATPAAAIVGYVLGAFGLVALAALAVVLLRAPRSTTQTKLSSRFSMRANTVMSPVHPLVLAGRGAVEPKWEVSPPPPPPPPPPSSSS